MRQLTDISKASFRSCLFCFRHRLLRLGRNLLRSGAVRLPARGDDAADQTQKYERSRWP